MFILQGMFLFQIWLSPVSLMKIQKKLWYHNKADTGTGKTYAKFEEPKSLFVACKRCSMQMGKNAATFLSLLFKGKVLTFWITF